MFKTASAINLHQHQHQNCTDFKEHNFQNALKKFTLNDLNLSCDHAADGEAVQRFIESIHSTLIDTYGSKLVNEVLQRCMKQEHLGTSASSPQLHVLNPLTNINNIPKMQIPAQKKKIVKRQFKQIDIRTLEDQLAKITAWKGGEPLMTRDVDMQHVLIKNQLRMKVCVADVINQKADSIICVSKNGMDTFSGSSAEIINFSGIQSKLAYRQKVYGELAYGHSYITDSGRLKNVKSLIQVAVPEAGTSQNRQQEIQIVEKSTVSILECAKTNQFKSIIIPLMSLRSSSNDVSNYEGLTDQEIANIQMDTIIRYFAQNEPETLQSIKFMNNFENDNHQILMQSFLKIMSRCPLKLVR